MIRAGPGLNEGLRRRDELLRFLAALEDSNVELEVIGEGADGLSGNAQNEQAACWEAVADGTLQMTRKEIVNTLLIRCYAFAFRSSRFAVKLR